MVVRIGRDQNTFRLAFVSNSDFAPSEFDSWIRRITEANVKPPSMDFVRMKAKEIQDAIHRPIKDERVVEQVRCGCRISVYDILLLWTNSLCVCV